jgi:hypothetical protein
MKHATIHKRLHKCLDELVADWINQTDKFPSQATVMDLITWSYEQTKNPTDPPNY